jgi:hypothetical protein
MFDRDTGDLRPEPAPWGEAEDSPQAWTPAAKAPQAPSEGNRPARHAKQVESTSEAEQAWHGSDDVTDFLGLDQDLFGGIAQAAAAAGVPQGALAPPAHAPAPAPARHPRREDEFAEPAPAAGEDPVGWLVDEMTEETVTLAGEEDVDVLEGSWSETDAPRRGVLPKVVGGLLAAAVLAALGIGLRGWLGSAPADGPTDTREIARAPQRPAGELEAPTQGTPTTAAADPRAGGAQGDEGAAGLEPRRPVAAAPQGAAPGTDRETSLEIVEAVGAVTREGAGDASVAADVDPGREGIPRAGPPSIARDPFEGVAPGTPGGATTEPAQPGAPNVVVQPLPPAGPLPGSGRLRYPTEEELRGIWQDSAIPLEAIDSPERIVTPNVGRVRAIMSEGQVYEGRLYAVGQGKIWLDVQLGRMGLAGESLASVEHVTTPEGGPALGDKGSEEYAGLPRVRVRMPGGVFYGKLLHQDGDRVTLLTDEGGRVTLESDEIEPAPATRRVTVKGFREDLAGG